MSDGSQFEQLTSSSKAFDNQIHDLIEQVSRRRIESNGEIYFAIDLLQRDVIVRHFHRSKEHSGRERDRERMSFTYDSKIGL